MPHFPFNLLNLKSNFSLKPNDFDEIFWYLNNLNVRISNSWYNNNYSTIELAEYWLDYFNITQNIILNKNLLKNYYLDSAIIFFAKNLQSYSYNFSFIHGTNLKM